MSKGNQHCRMYDGSDTVKRFGIVVLLAAALIIGAYVVVSTWFSLSNPMHRWRLLYITPASSPVRELYVEERRAGQWRLILFEFDSDHDGLLDKIVFCGDEKPHVLKIEDLPPKDLRRVPTWEEVKDGSELSVSPVIVDAVWLGPTDRKVQLVNEWVLMSDPYRTATNAAIR